MAIKEHRTKKVKNISFRIDNESLDRLSECAEKLNMSKAKILRMGISLMTDYCNKITDTEVSNIEN